MRRVLMALFSGLLLSGCTSAVVLRHPQTGQTVQCGPYSIYGQVGWIAAAQREARCLDDFQRQGYERVP